MNTMKDRIMTTKDLLKELRGCKMDLQAARDIIESNIQRIIEIETTLIKEGETDD